MNFIFSTAYLPPVSYFVAICQSEKILLEAEENYIKQSYRNRCRIASANGVMDLNIPVESNDGKKLKITEVRISDHGNWQIQHWRSITAAYNSSPFFEYYDDDFRLFFEKKWKFLWDFNTELLQKLLLLLDINANFDFTTTYQTDFQENTIDLRNSIHPKKETVYFTEPYYQVFEQKHGFIPDLSIIDLLFNMGNEAVLILKN